MGRNIPLSVSQAWFTAFFYWTPLLGTLCSAVFLHCFFSCNIQCVAHPAGAGWRPTASDVMCERRGPRSEGCSPRVVGERPSYSLFFSRGLWRGADLRARARFRHLDHGRNRRTEEERSIHGHLHANVTLPNSCYMDDIYCCSSFTVAVTFFPAKPDSNSSSNK